jgi:hypothetical protein
MKIASCREGTSACRLMLSVGCRGECTLPLPPVSAHSVRVLSPEVAGLAFPSSTQEAGGRACPQEGT